MTKEDESLRLLRLLLRTAEIANESDCGTAYLAAIMEYAKEAIDALEKEDSIECAHDYSREEYRKAVTMGIQMSPGLAVNPNPLPTCDHDWVDARNEVVASGEYCSKCGELKSNE